MYQNRFGTQDQICFDSEADYYEFLGYLAKRDETTKVVWENNDEQGAWGAEGRILFYTPLPSALRARLKHTSGAGRIVSRVNCNAFVEHIAQYHRFAFDGLQDEAKIRASIPAAHIEDYERGLRL